MVTVGMENSGFSLQKAELPHSPGEIGRCPPSGEMKDRMDPRTHSEQLGELGGRERETTSPHRNF